MLAIKLLGSVICTMVILSNAIPVDKRSSIAATANSDYENRDPDIEVCGGLECEGL